MTNPLRALIAKWRDTANAYPPDAPADCLTAVRMILMCANELEAALAAPQPDLIARVDLYLVRHSHPDPRTAYGDCVGLLRECRAALAAQTKADDRHLAWKLDVATAFMGFDPALDGMPLPEAIRQLIARVKKSERAVNVGLPAEPSPASTEWRCDNCATLVRIAVGAEVFDCVRCGAGSFTKAT